ncbi:hypothetical protein MHZ93_23375 [Roseomonas sp. ACRSG]|nr:hypothetical protein [Roseomonas sp. ACRSG]
MVTMTLIEREAANALWWVVAAVLFVLWQCGRWLVARGRWQAQGNRAVEPAPRIMDGLPDYVARLLRDFMPVLLAGIPLAMGFAWLIFSFFAVAIPLQAVHGYLGAAGGLMVCVVGFVAGTAVLVRIGEQGRAQRDHDKARIIAQADASRLS